MAVRGSWGAVEWARDKRGRAPAHEFFSELSASDQAKVLALFGKLAEVGSIKNREKFKKVGDLWEFKSHQIRLLGGYRPNRRFLVAIGVIKKRDDLRPQDIKVAVRVLREHDETEGSV